MMSRKEIIYTQENGDIDIITEFGGNTSLTVNQALELCNIDMDEYADTQGWDGYDWNSLDIRFKEQ